MKYLFFISFSFITLNVFSQDCSTLNIQLQSQVSSPCNKMTMATLHDQLDRPYLYIANKEAGLEICDISNLSSPNLVANVSTMLFDTLDVMNVEQDGNYLYLAVGNSFINPFIPHQKGGMVIVDVTNPQTPVFMDYYEIPNSFSGGGIVKVEGNYAYLGAMQSGIVILDISNKNNIQFVSQYIPDINFPPISNPDSSKYNARGMAVKNSIIYLCYDAGGIRIIDCTNKNVPVETGRWCNIAMYTPFNHPRAYNNLVLQDSILYVAVDYAGMEVLNVADTSNISMLGWWNPYNAPNTNWVGCNVHANEIRYNPYCNQIFLSTGKSEMHVIDVSDPTQPDSCNTYGSTSDTMATWGVGVWENQIYLSYICDIIGLPVYSNVTGVKILTYTPCVSSIKNYSLDDQITLFPIPANNKITIKNCPIGVREILVSNIMGETLSAKYIYNSNDEIIIDISVLCDGIYFVNFFYENRKISAKFIKN